MIIGIDASRANREKKTGVEFYAFFLIEEMKKMSNSEHVRFVLYSDEPLRGELAELPENWESRVLCWPPKRFWTQIRLSWEMLVNPPDVLFIPAHVFPIIHPKKTVMTVHDIAAARFPKSYNWFERWYSLFSARMAVKKLWKVIVPSQFVKDELMKTLKHENIKTSVVVVRHGYDKRYRKVENETEIQNVLNKYGIRKPFLLSVGRWETKKNTVRIISAFNIVSDELRTMNCELVLVGKPGHGYEEVKQAYGRSPYKDRILMPGYVDPEDLVYIMNAAEVFVFPSLYEGFGLPVLEAMACGAPVVAGKGSSLEEVGGEACVYVDPLDVNDIACGIKQVLENQEMRKGPDFGRDLACGLEKREMGLERVEMFSWEKCAGETIDVLLG